MTDRRAFIQGGASLLAFSAWPLAAAPRELPSFAGPRRSLMVLIDRDLDATAAAEAAADGYAVFEFRSDVAQLWMNEIEPRLRAGPVVIAGHTSAATLFCLDLLARDYGARTTQRVADGASVKWVISSSPGQRAALAPAAVRAEWSQLNA